ncbi:serine threonine-protein phosphatase 6 regulatory subunit [Musa troglodytarum]|uniref:Serine threonine-protein phosphatase 6 regulatory subunit n=1 Tax=Musa troglodytarum TaxID=320322 RepID=A0A9E7KKX8_9LILI|nr:serine threonine-protein phosphatase 6 regulatory subunit [Musa troglodytarum]
MPIAGPLPEPLPILSRAVDGCSNRNSVGGTGSTPPLRFLIVMREDGSGFIEDGKEAHAAGAGQVLGDWGRHQQIPPRRARCQPIRPHILPKHLCSSETLRPPIEGFARPVSPLPFPVLSSSRARSSSIPLRRSIYLAFLFRVVVSLRYSICFPVEEDPGWGVWGGCWDLLIRGRQDVLAHDWIHPSVDAILEKENFTLEELLDEDEIIQECKALNTRLINFLREKTQVERLLRYIVEEPPEGADNKHVFKLPFIACEIFICEVDIILRTLVEDVQLMDLLFSFLKPDHPHSTFLAGYFSKVVICLMMRKTGPLLNYIQGHPEMISQLVDLIGITSIMEVLIRLIGADENMHSNNVDTMQWLEDTDVLEMIVDKFNSSDSFEVHANIAEILCAITRCAPPALAAKICSPSYVGKLFCHALQDSRPKSVLYHSLSFCICLLDPKRLVASSFQAFRSQLNHGSFVPASEDSIQAMLERLGDLLKLLDISSSDSDLLTTYGKLQPPLGKHRLKIVEFISVLLTTGSEAVEKELIRLGAIKRVVELYPFNNFLHHHVEDVVGSCLESKRTLLIEHILHDCDIVNTILAAEKQSFLSTDSTKATISAEGQSPPRIGNSGHMTRIANKLIQLGNNNSLIQTHLQENSDWVGWHSNVLLKRNAIENVHQWTCGRPTTLQEPARDSDDEDFRDRDFDVAALASNLSQAFRCGIYTNDDIEEAQVSFERDDEDVYFDDESAEVVISSLRLGDDQDSPLFTNSNWFAFENDTEVDDRLTNSLASSSPNSDETSDDEPDEVVVGENNNLNDAATSLQVMDVGTTSESKAIVLGNGPANEPKEGVSNSSTSEGEQSPGWVEWRETSEPKVAADILNGDSGTDKEMDEVALDADECGPPLGGAAIDRRGGDVGGPTNVVVEDPSDTAKGGLGGGGFVRIA